MNVRLWVCVGAALLAARPATSQHDGGAAMTVHPPREASQLDFLIGQWDLTVTPKVAGLVARIHGVPRLHGTWKAWRALDGWGIEDELRVVDESGNPQALTHFVRIYDPSRKRWAVAGVDAYRQQITESTALWNGRELVATGAGTDGEGKRYISRTRIDAVTPASFRYQQDRSYDEGTTWDEARVVILATRAAAAAAR